MTLPIPLLSGHIHTLSINWRNHAFSGDLVPFLSHIWRCLGSSLHKLIIVAPLARMQTILYHASTVTSLQHLELRIQNDNFVPTVTDVHVMRRMLIPLVHRNMLTLRSLIVKLQPEEMDLSPFIAELPFLPSLAKFEANAIIDEVLLRQFLLRHAETLIEFSWTRRSLPEHPGTSDEDANVILRTLSTANAPLRKLGLYVFDARTLRSLGNLKHSLTELRLEGVKLTSEDLDGLRGMKLQVLRVNVCVLNLRVVVKLVKLVEYGAEMVIGIGAVESENNISVSPITFLLHLTCDLCLPLTNEYRSKVLSNPSFCAL